MSQQLSQGPASSASVPGSSTSAILSSSPENHHAHASERPLIVEAKPGLGLSSFRLVPSHFPAAYYRPIPRLHQSLHNFLKLGTHTNEALSIPMSTSSTLAKFPFGLCDGKSITVWARWREGRCSGYTLVGRFTLHFTFLGG